jgi:pimeloyl-ACP methyl ester carboxylesterase
MIMLMLTLAAGRVAHRVPFGFGVLLLASTAITASAQLPTQPGRHRVDVVSTSDGTSQPSYLILPPSYEHGTQKTPIVVSLHSWSFGVEQRNEELERAVGEKGWLYLFPDFRGRNDTLEACASDVARRDVIDALEWVTERYVVDLDRVYLTGVSGGGFMTLAMVASYPDRWTAASAWVPLSDLRAWYDFHAGDQYGEMTRECVGGDPGDDPSVASEMEGRSPLHTLGNAADVALDIAAGRLDGHDGAPIPVWHSLVSFNAIADALGEPVITAREIAELSRHDPRLDAPGDSDRVTDPSFGREIYLRRHAGKSRVTIFEGGHEGLAEAAIAWFEAHPLR